MSARPGDLRIDLLHTLEESRAAAELWRTVWGGDAYPVQAALVLAQVHAGGYASGAWLGDRLVGASLGLLGPPDHPVLHSHITGVVGEAAGRGIGLALKQHQAAWCRDHGIATVTWTFDPLVARNAWFNLSRLGVEVQGYVVDHYGEMPDDRNRGQGSDRLLVAWDVRTTEDGDPDHPPSDVEQEEPPLHVPAGEVAGGTGPDVGCAVTVGRDGQPVTHVPTGDDLLVALPTDIEAIRRRDPALAIRWRHAVRDAMAPRLTPNPDGGRPPWAVAGFTRDGAYHLRRHPGPPPPPDPRSP